MLVVTVELWPGGDESKRRVMGKAHIMNNGTGSQGRGNYTVRLYKWNADRSDSLRTVWKSGSVEDFDRVNRGPWDLLFVALRNIVGGRS